MFAIKTKTLAIAVLLAVSGIAKADQTPADQIRILNETIALQSARLGKLEVDAKIAAKTAEINKLGASMSGSSGMGVPLSSFGDDVPLVRAIDGVDGKLKATLLMRNGGGVQTVSEGEKYGAWTVKTISVGTVALVRGKEILKLNFGTEPSTGSNGTNPPNGQGIGFPTLPSYPGSNAVGK